MKHLLSLLTLLSVSFTAFAQHTITGEVEDQMGETVPGATVILKDNPTIGTITDLDGKFVLESPKANPVLVISFIGYATQEVATEGKKTVKVILHEDNQLLDEVVLIGYGTQRDRKSVV